MKLPKLNFLDTLKFMLKILFIFLLFSNIVHAKPIKVAVLDTGIDLYDFPYPKQLQLGSVTQYGKSYTLQDSNTPGHGTHVAGTIIERSRDNVIIIPFKVFDLGAAINRIENLSLNETEKGEQFATTIRYAKKLGARIINISGGSNRFYPADYEIIKNSPKTLFVVAAGNNVFEKWEENPKFEGPQDLDLFQIAAEAKFNFHKYNFYPCAFSLPNVVCVGNAAKDDKGQMKIISNYGSMFVDLFANGENLLAPVVGGDREFMSGSSMATPQVTALFAKEWFKNPKLNIKQLKEKVFSQLTKYPELESKSKTGLFLDQ